MLDGVNKRCNDCLMVLTKPWTVRILLDCKPANNDAQLAITCSKLTIETLAIGVVLVSFWWLWTYFTPCSSVSIVNFEQVNTAWVKLFTPSYSKKSSRFLTNYFNQYLAKYILNYLIFQFEFLHVKRHS